MRWPKACCTRSSLKIVHFARRALSPRSPSGCDEWYDSCMIGNDRATHWLRYTNPHRTYIQGASAPPVLRLAMAAADGAVGGDSLLHARGGGPATHRRGVPHLSGPRPASSTFMRPRREMHCQLAGKCAPRLPSRVAVLVPYLVDAFEPQDAEQTGTLLATRGVCRSAQHPRAVSGSRDKVPKGRARIGMVGSNDFG